MGILHKEETEVNAVDQAVEQTAAQAVDQAAAPAEAKAAPAVTEEKPVKLFKESKEAKEAKAAKTEPKADPADIHNDEMGVISSGTVIHGDITTQGHLAVAGSVDGSVNCAGNLMLTGESKGKITCNNIVIESCNCSPNLTVRGNVSIKENTRITGDIHCKHISVMGTINGNIDAEGNVGLTKNAVVEGNITAAVLAIEPGAKIKGFVDIK